MYKLTSPSKHSDDIKVGFNRKIGALERELTNVKKTKGNFVLGYIRKRFLVLQSINELLFMALDKI